jgi:hypothetical protein
MAAGSCNNDPACRISMKFTRKRESFFDYAKMIAQVSRMSFISLPAIEHVPFGWGNQRFRQVGHKSNSAPAASERKKL